MLAELREIAETMPVPSPAWHPYVRLIRQVEEELLAGIEELEGQPDGEALVERFVGAELEPRAGTALAELPLPAGEHPYLGEIRVAFEAALLVQAACAAASLVV